MTTRLILEAATHLSRGEDVVIVAVPKTEAVRICRIVCQVVRALGIPCSNIKGADPDAPALRAREYNNRLPLPTPKQVVLYDHTARFERQQSLPPAIRSVIT